MSVVRSALYVFIWLLPFVSAFALTGTLTLSVLWSVVLLVLYIFGVLRKGIVANPLKIENLLLGGFFVFVFIGYLINGFLEVKPTNHLVAYFVTVFIFFILINQVMHGLGRSWDSVWSIARVLFYSMMFVSIFTMAEFALRVFANINVNDFIPRPHRGVYVSSALDRLLARVRGFAEESGQHAMMMETFAPVSIYFALNKWDAPKIIRWACAVILGLSLLFTFSAGAFIFLPLAITFALGYFLLFRHVRPIYLMGGVAVALLLNLATLPLIGVTIVGLVVTIVGGKIGGSASLSDRTDRFSAFAEFYESADTFHRIVGFGPSGFRVADLEKSILSLYPTILFEGGLFGFLFFVSFLAYIFYIIVKIEHQVKVFLMIGFISCCSHYAIVAGYWRPWLWFLCALACLIYRTEIQEKRKKEINE